MYTRKTVDIYVLLVKWGYSDWEYVLHEDTFADAKLSKKEYIENDKSGIFKIVKKRVSKEIYENSQKFNDWLRDL